MTGPAASAPPGWYATEQGWRWWDGTAWGPLAPPPVPEEESGKTLAVLSHLGIVLGGFVLPLVVYLTEGRRNGFVRAHSREALNFQLCFLGVWFVVMGAFVIGFVASVGSGGPPGLYAFVFPVAWALWLFAIVCGVIGAVRAGQGRRFRYPVSIRFVRD
jgi:uncharacterized Tic20 family protein